MSDKETQILEQQIDKLDKKNFDLEAWKKYTIVILARIFGDKSNKIVLIEQLEYEFSSWSLRDASGNESYEEGTKKLAREILQAAIDELKVFGLPEITEEKADESIKVFLNILLDELKGSQVKKLKSIIKSKESKDEKQRMIKEILEGIGEYGAYDVLTMMLLSPLAVKLLKA